MGVIIDQPGPSVIFEDRYTVSTSVNLDDM